MRLFLPALLLLAPLLTAQTVIIPPGSPSFTTGGWNAPRTCPTHQVLIRTTINGGVCIQLTAADITGSAGGVWGSITGTLSAQTDLGTALGLKAPLAAPVFTGQVTIPDFTLAGHTHLNTAGGGGLDAAAIISGAIAFARMPTGTSGATVAIGNHTHSAASTVAAFTGSPTGLKFLADDGTLKIPAGGATIASTLNLLSGDGAGNGISSGIALADIVPNKGGINLTKPPYYASGYTATAYSITGIGAGVTTTITLSTVTGFSVGQYMTCLFGNAASGKQTVKITGIASLAVSFAAQPALGSVTAGVVTNCWTEGATTGTATTGGTTTSVAVLSSATYSANQGVYLAGAGAAGIDYIGTVVSVPDSTHVVVTPAVSTNVSAVLFQHDETAAFQGVVTANAATGADVYLPGPEAGLYGVYNINGPYQDPGAIATHCDCVIQAPNIPASTVSQDQVVFNFHGDRYPIHGWVPAASTISTLKTGGGNLFAGYAAAASFGKFTQVHFQFEKLRFSTYVDPDLIVLNGTNLIGLSGRFLAVMGEGTDGASTHAASAGIIMPATTNYANTDLFDVYVNNFYTGILAKEHTRMFFTDVTGNTVGYEIQSSSTSHPVFGAYMMAERNTTGLYSNTSGAQVDIAVFSVENNTADIVGSNTLKGYVGVQASLTADPVATGINLLTVFDIKNGLWIGRGFNLKGPAAGMSMQNTDVASYNNYGVVTAGGVSVGGFGFGNSGTAAPTTSALYVHSYGFDTILEDTGAEYMRRTTGTPKVSWTGVHPIYLAGAAPPIVHAATCGTTPGIAGSDASGRVTVGSGGSATSCQVDFGTAWATAPVCVGGNETTALAAKFTASTTSLTIASGSAFTAADKLVYKCTGY